MFSLMTSWSGQDRTENRSPLIGDEPRHQTEANTNTTEIKVSKNVCSVAFLDANGKHIVGGGFGGVLRIWQTADGQEFGTAMNAGSTLLNIAVSSDGKWVVGGTGNGRVIVWDAGRYEKVTEIKGHDNLVRAVDVSLDAARIASGSDDRRVCVWSAESGELLLGPLEHDRILAAVKFSPNGELLATATWLDASVRIYDGRDGCLLIHIPVTVTSYENQALAWSLDGMLLFASSFNGYIKCFDVSTATMRSHWAVCTGNNGGIRCMVLANNGKFVAASANSSVVFWDTATYEQIGSVVKHPDVIRSIAISQNYSLAIAGGRTITIRSLRDILGPCYVDDDIWDANDMADSSSGSLATIVVDDDIDPIKAAAAKLDTPMGVQYPLFDTTPSPDEEYSPNDLTSHVKREGHDPVASGGFADIYRGNLQTKCESIRVAIKAIRTYSAEDTNFVKKRKRLLREIKIWLTLKHINVLPLLGITTGFGQFPAMVCPWADHGSLTTYLEEHYDKISLVELLTLLDDAASGLQYLHSRSVVHGDLSGSNVLVCKNGRAYISDFGLSTLLTELGGSTFATSAHARGTLRWTAPELLDLQIYDDDMENPKVVPSKHSDMYSFGGVMLQVLTGKVPYYYYVREAQVINAVSRGMTPRRPSSPVVTERRWKFIEWCWATVDAALSRPSSDDLVRFTNEELADIVAR